MELAKSRGEGEAFWVGVAWGKVQRKDHEGASKKREQIIQSG